MTLYRFDQIADLITSRVNPGDTVLDRYVGLEHLDPESLKLRHWGTPSDVIGEKLHFWPGDIIYGKRRAYQRKLAVAEFEGICSAHAMVLRAKADVCLPELLPFFMQSETFHQRAVDISVGSLSPTINWSTLAKQEFPLPPLDEQRRIADLLWAVDDSLLQTNKLFESLEQLRKSFVVEKFTQLFTGDAQIVKMTKAGEVLMGRQRSPQYEKGISPRPYLRVANVYDGYIDTSDVKTMDFSEKEFENFGLRYGDVLLVEGHSSAEVVGRSAIYKGEVPGACFQNTLLRFRPYTVSSEFAHYYFRYCLYTKKFSHVAKQTTIAHLGSTRFSSMKFPLVTEKVDKEITNTLNEIETNLVHVQQQISAAKNLKNQIFASMLTSKG